MSLAINIINVRGFKGDRSQVCYVGRQCAGWPDSPWGNPYRVGGYGNWTAERAIAAFRQYAESMTITSSSSFLPLLWEACGRGKKPLGCWCVDAECVDGVHSTGVVCCHAQVLAEMLCEKYGGVN